MSRHKRPLFIGSINGVDHVVHPKAGEGPKDWAKRVAARQVAYRLLKAQTKKAKVTESTIQETSLSKDNLNRLRSTTYHQPRSVTKFSDHAFRGSPQKRRVVIPLDPPKSKLKAKVSKHLAGLGFKVHDYHAGLAKDKHGRDVKIGKVLHKAGSHDLLNKFNTDPARAQQGEHEIAITRHPYHVAGMSSDDHPWSKTKAGKAGSCLSITGGSNCRYLHREVKAGTHVAYLIKDNDEAIRKPLARIALKPYYPTTPTFKSRSYGATVLRPEEKVYGNAPSSFQAGLISTPGNAIRNNHITSTDAGHAYESLVSHPHMAIIRHDRNYGSDGSVIRGSVENLLQGGRLRLKHVKHARALFGSGIPESLYHYAWPAMPENQK